MKQRSFIIPALGLIGVCGLAFYLYLRPTDSTQIAVPVHTTSHPIDALIQTAEAEFDNLRRKQSHDLQAATERYRARRGRHPPPGFDEWYDFAKSKNSLVIEDFFDQIYHDLSPYWAIEPRELRRQAKSIPTRIVIRGHNTTMKTDEDRVWMNEWHNLVATIQQYLPDLDMPINVMDEPRLVVPWENIRDSVKKEQKGRSVLEKSKVVAEYQDLSSWDTEEISTYDPGFVVGDYRNLSRVGCPPNSPGQLRYIDAVDFANPPWEFDNFERMSYHGYIGNFTLAKDVCARPEVQALHGTFIEPISISTSHNLFPLFGGSKLSVNNEILLPPAMYWADNDFYSGGDKDHGGAWETKHDKMFWRGAATGGRARQENWKGFQRHRFLAMTNETMVRMASENSSAGINFRLPSLGVYDLNTESLSQFITEYADTGFVHLVCTPFIQENPYCPYLDDYFKVVTGLPMKEMYDYKYLPDIDGNSFSGRYRGFLLSTSLPMKATIYNEWHDSRLIPWVHFVPMDITYRDVYGILSYLINHDSVARRIALSGKDWGGKVLRKEDMQIYVYRLLLEYARICDDRREFLGYVDQV